MNARVKTVIRKEWLDLVKNKVVLGTLIFLPIFMTFLSSFMLVMAAKMPAKPGSTDKLPAAILARAADPQDASVLMMTFVAMMMFLIVPTSLPSVLATQSILGEKKERSLEPLLATPLRTWELLIGKIVACWLPAAVPAIMGAAVYIGVVLVMTPVRVHGFVLCPEFILTVMGLGPLLGLLAVCVSVLISARSVDVSSAQALSGLIVLPVVGISVAQILGGVTLTPSVVCGMAAIVLAIDVGALFLCIEMFEREAILTQWK